jgi:non-ribosomal peptide synthetase component E (peptide arylation enzyme)
MEVRVVDPRGTLAPAGEEGALQVRGPFLFVGYAERLEMTRALMVPADDGRGDWFDTGDLAFIDEDGYLRISGRTKDVIIRGGENIPVAYVENVLYEHPDIEAVAVVAVPDPRLQERACACVVLRSGAALAFEDMQAFLGSKGVAKQYWPEKLVLLDDFPKTPSGKVQKFQLREQVAQS